jgi:hypothetical protein
MEYLCTGAAVVSLLILAIPALAGGLYFTDAGSIYCSSSTESDT